MNNKHHISIKDSVLKTIHQGKVQMKPHWHFVFKGVLLVVGTIFLSLALLYMSSFILFILHQNGLIFAPLFGLFGIGVFLKSLPWTLILIAIVFVIVLEILVKKYSFGYQKPLLYIVVGIVVIVVLGTFAVSKIGLHQRLSRYTTENRTPIARAIYGDIANPRMRDVHIGTITQITNTGFLAETKQGKYEVIVMLATRIPRGVDFKEGDSVLVLGMESDGVIKAVGLRPIKEDIWRQGRELKMLPNKSPHLGPIR